LIVVDSNILAYLYLPSDFTARAEALLRKDPEWAAPILWRSELRNILAGFLRRGSLQLEDAHRIQQAAEQLLSGREHLVDSRLVLDLLQQSNCSAYDCEFVALAHSLGLRLVTADRQLIKAFPRLAMAMP
jgi:predicted nucleic acid-binding protein